MGSPCRLLILQPSLVTAVFSICLRCSDNLTNENFYTFFITAVAKRPLDADHAEGVTEGAMKYGSPEDRVRKGMLCI